jgi:hypothetical protein
MEALFVCDVGALVEPDVAAVEALARLQLAARRSGCRIRLYDVPPQLGGLLELMGLGDIFPPGASTTEAWRKPEQGEQSLGVEEEADPGDRPVPDLEDLQGPRIERSLGSRLVLAERGGTVRFDRDQA